MKNLKNFHEWPLTTRILLVGLLCVVTFYAGYTWDISALKENLSSLEDQERDLKQQYELVLSKQTLLIDELAVLPQLQQLLITWHQKIISYKELPELMNEILKIGGINHLYFNLFSPGEAIKSTPYIKVPIKMIAVGSYHQLADFISQIANMKRIVEIGDFTFSNENKTDVLGAKLAAIAASQQLLTAELTFTVYILQQGAEI